MVTQPRLVSVFTLLLCLCGQVAQADVGLIEAGEGQSAVWLRRVVRLSAPAADSATLLQVRGSCRVNVYVNGQRLARNADVAAGHVLQFNVTELIRQGANGFAVSAHQTDPAVPVTVSAWLRHNESDEALVTDGAWKQRRTVPPVGWEKTDFNPHGWEDVKPSGTFAVAEAASDETDLVNWKRPVPPSGFGTPLTFQADDHVVLLGGTFVERAQLYGHLEIMLTGSMRDSKVTFRNLGWSGDTVFAESRGIFDTPERGFERLVEHIRAEEPTVVLVCYGQNEAMTSDGADSVRRFSEQLKVLHQQLQSTGARFVLVSPHPLLFAADPIPSPNRFNPAIVEYSREVQRVAEELDVAFVDLISDFPGALAEAQQTVQPDVPFRTLREESFVWTDNGMHWNEPGYRRMGVLFAERSLQQDIRTPAILVDRGSRTIQAEGGEVTRVDWSGDTGVTFEFQADRITPLPWMIDVSTQDAEDDLRRVTCSSSNGATARLIPSDSPETQLRFTANEHPQYEQLRALITKKNELYFHRWRPQNITYLFGFRKHEQGNNAAEIAMFDPLVDELEQQIHALQQPVAETVRVTW